MWRSALCACCALLSAGIAAEPPRAAGLANGLILVGSQQVTDLSATEFQLDPAVKSALEKKGLVFDTKSLYAPLDPETLAKYRVVILPDLPAVSPASFASRLAFERSRTFAENLAMLPRYVAAGGGLFFSPGPSAAVGLPQVSSFLGLFGAGAQSGQARDEKRLAVLGKDGPFPAEYSWTTNVERDPITEGVGSIFYPAGRLRWDGVYSTPVLNFSDPAWKPLVRGMDTSVAAVKFGHGSWLVRSRQPILAAQRTYGKGRVFVFAPVAYHTFWHPFADPPEGRLGEALTGPISGVVWERGAGGRRSDVHRLVENALGWLAQPPAEGEIAVEASPHPAVFPEWLFTWRDGDGSKWFKVFVGARSTFSDGSGSVADCARAARLAGVGLLVMTETFESFDPRKWEDFRRECASAEDERLKVLPGLDMADRYGARYILMNPGQFPDPEILAPDGKSLRENEYLAFGFEGSTSILHRPSGSPIPAPLQKHFQGVSVFTYRDGKLVDDGFAAYEWQLFHFSNPMPFVVHETFSPAEITAAAGTGAQLLVGAKSVEDVRWYLTHHGMTHFWESPVRMQISSGPVITGLQRTASDLKISVSSARPLDDVRMLTPGMLYRRWKPASGDFHSGIIKGPTGQFTWSLVIAKDKAGGFAISPGIVWGGGAVHAWRCADRQNWWNYPVIYPGTPLNQFNIALCGVAAAGFPEALTPDSGLSRTPSAPIIEPALASDAAFVEDGILGQRYRDASYADVRYDARPPHATAPADDLRGRVRYRQYYSTDPARDNFLPLVKEVELESLAPAYASDIMAAMFTQLDIQEARVTGDRSPAGTKALPYVDLSRGQSAGGLIALSDGIRVTADGRVGFPSHPGAQVPTGTRWQAAFVTVRPDQVERWKALMGFAAKLPFELRTTRGELTGIAYVVTANAADGQFLGEITRAVAPAATKGLTGGNVDRDKAGKETLQRDIGVYRAPFAVSGVNPNWPAFSWRAGPGMEAIPVFEGRALARVDVTKAGPVGIGNVVVASAPEFRIGLLEWTADKCAIEVNNPTDDRIEATIRTADVPGRLPARWKVSIAGGQSKVLAMPSPPAASGGGAPAR